MNLTVAAAWVLLDQVVAAAPAALRKGPRGGGRDRDAIARHVVEAEAAYAAKLGVRVPKGALGDPAGVATMRTGVLEALGRASDGMPLRTGGWTSRYAARRIAWHVLDHAWEIEDRS